MIRWFLETRFGIIGSNNSLVASNDDQHLLSGGRILPM
jgi:hypothetical protein